MSSPAFILTKSPVNLDDIPLGSFVPDRSTPSTDLLKPGNRVTAEHRRASYDANLDISFNNKSESWFQILLTEILKVTFKVERSKQFRATAEGGYIYMLHQPIEIFETLVADGNNAKLYRENRKGGRSSAQAQPHIVPPTGVVAGGPNVGVAGGHEHMQEVHGDVKTCGERIYAICYRKVQIKTPISFCGFGGGDAKVTLRAGDKWKVSDRSLEPPSGKIRSRGLASDEIIEATMEDTDDIKDCVHAGHGFMIPREFSDLQRSMLKKNGPKVAGLPFRGASSPPRRASLLSRDARPPEFTYSARSTSFSQKDVSALARAACLLVRGASSLPKGANLSSRDVRPLPRDTVRGVDCSASGASSALMDASTLTRRASLSVRGAALPTKPGAPKPRRFV
ncbi:hypothetical protein EPUS_00107 [Endocarpon pusillum Z07020]|uniref:Uncharacterized protein n=1 Tax=Endocarpon pusillum (strain Z07020 / HMAS-L-300199) TaxID=1263415 RepID=U1HWZ5_ENDPU|nr:uncharacterized protein EPUS_00107 [Endocarpon pusillum Z07020]ERF75315.1 hypothetical protein EPUS_00107 [Endocarpon pusillum Z07020]